MSQEFKLTDTVLQLMRHCGQFRVQLAPDEATAVLKRMPVYNYIPKNVHKLVEELVKHFGDRVTIEVGNDYSLVIFARVQSLFKEEHLRQADALLTEAGRKFKAVEVHVTPRGSGLEVRYWWD